jgi:hypothetical protein
MFLSIHFPDSFTSKISPLIIHCRSIRNFQKSEFRFFYFSCRVVKMPNQEAVSHFQWFSRGLKKLAAIGNQLLVKPECFRVIEMGSGFFRMHSKPSKCQTQHEHLVHFRLFSFRIGETIWISVMLGSAFKRKIFSLLFQLG